MRAKVAKATGKKFILREFLAQVETVSTRKPVSKLGEVCYQPLQQVCE